MYFFKSVLALGLAALGASSPIANSTMEGRIVRGDLVAAYEAPWYCGIYRVDQYNDYEYVCGSSLIAEQTLLTSAECLKPTENYVAKCGSTSLLSGPFQEIPIDTFRRHPGYGQTAGDTITNNIALAYFKKPIQCGDRIQFLELQTDHVTKSSSNYRVYGLGMDDFPTGQADEIKPTWALKYLDSQPRDIESCRKYFKDLLYYNEIPAGTFCGMTKDPNGSQCQLDQGGPYIDMSTDRQVGVVSYVSPFCSIERPAVYTSVQYFLSWIIENLNPSNYPTKLEKKKNPWH